MQRCYCVTFLLIKKLARNSIAFLIALFIIFIRPVVKIYLIRLDSARLGHFALGTEAMLSSFEINSEKKRRKLLLFYLTCQPVSNEQLLEMFKRSLLILPFPRFCSTTNMWLSRILRENYHMDFVKSFEPHSSANDQEGLLRKTKSHISFSSDELENGERLLIELGVQPGSKFVCLLVRDQGYL